MRIAFAGNPNSGKTTMYNALTGRNEKVGNWAGVTVDRKEASIKKVYAAIDANDKEAAKAALVEATATIDKATSKGVYHKNTSSRKVSRLAKSVNEMA